MWSDVSEASCVRVCVASLLAVRLRKLVCMYNQIPGGTVYLNEMDSQVWSDG